VRHFTALRQVLLEKVRRFVAISEAGPAAWHFLVMFDGDLLADGSQGFHPSAIHALLGLQTPSIAASVEEVSTTPSFADAPWDLVCANQLANWPEPGRYRDVFAFRNESWKSDYMALLARDQYFKGNKLLPVKSCFSGMGLYSMRAIQESGCNYTYEDEVVCEHVAFHKCLSRHGHGKIAIYPPWAVRVNDHGVVRQSCATIGGPAFLLHEPHLPKYVPRPAPAPFIPRSGGSHRRAPQKPRRKAGRSRR